MLKINKVTKSFGDIIALDEISFSVEEGEFVFLTGPSGAGKTTLLRLILRELVPDTGEILLQEENISKLPPKSIPKIRQKLGVVFQDFKLLPERTMRENVEVALAVSGVPQKEWKDRVNHVLDLVGLIDRSRLFPSQLSGGELQRVSIARALVVNPKIILADEPTGNLDWDTADKLMDLFDKINKEGKTIMMATHHRGIVDKLQKREIKIEPKSREKTKEKAGKKPKDKKKSTKKKEKNEET